MLNDKLYQTLGAEEGLLRTFSREELLNAGLTAEQFGGLEKDTFQNHPEVGRGYLGALVLNYLARNVNGTERKVIEQINKARKDFPDFDIFDTYENDLKNFGGDIKSEGKIKRGYERCYTMETIPVIGADSVVYFCHDKTYSEDGALGSIKDRSFKEL